METIRKYKWFLLASGAIAGVAVAAYTIWTRKKTIVPFRQLVIDRKNLDPVIHTVEQILVPEQLAALEGMALRYYYKYKKEEREQRQLQRCAHLKEENRKKYFDSLISDVRFEAECFTIIYDQICNIMRIPLEIFRKSQRAYLSNKGLDYKSAFDKQVNLEQEKNAHGKSETEANNLFKDLAGQKDKKLQELTLLLSDELVGKLTKEEESEALAELANLMAHDFIFLEYGLTEDQVREVLNFYNFNDPARDEVIEI